jgi:hypothetical protein
MKERKDFEEWKVAEVYKLQDGVCKKCGAPLARGFERHHIDGNAANNSIGNLELLCSRCHGSEAYSTYLKQKAKALNDVESIVAAALDGKMAGTIIDKLIDAVKLGLGITDELYGYAIEKPPASLKLERYLEESNISIREYERGLRDGIVKGIDVALGAISDRNKEKNKDY